MHKWRLKYFINDRFLLIFFTVHSHFDKIPAPSTYPVKATKMENTPYNATYKANNAYYDVCPPQQFRLSFLMPVSLPTKGTQVYRSSWLSVSQANACIRSALPHNPVLPVTGPKVRVYCIFKSNLLIYLSAVLTFAFFSGVINFSFEKLRACYYLKNKEMKMSELKIAVSCSCPDCFSTQRSCVNIDESNFIDVAAIVLSINDIWTWKTRWNWRHRLWDSCFYRHRKWRTCSIWTFAADLRYSNVRSPYRLLWPAVRNRRQPLWNAVTSAVLPCACRLCQSG